MVDFLRDQECQSAGISTIDLEDEEYSIEEATEANEPLMGSTKKRRTVNQQLAERNSLLREAVQQLKARPEIESKDEAALYCDAWASTYRKLSPGQQIFARRAIDEVLVLGQLEQLTFNSFRLSRTSSTTSIPQFSSSSSSSPVQYAVHYAPNMQTQQTTPSRTISRTSSTTSIPEFSPSLSTSPPVQYSVRYAPNMQAPQTMTSRTISRTSSTTSIPEFSPSLSSSPPVQYSVRYAANTPTPQTATNAMFAAGPEEETYESIQQLFQDPMFI